MNCQREYQYKMVSSQQIDFQHYQQEQRQAQERQALMELEQVRRGP
jgi:hypothetical protein